LSHTLNAIKHDTPEAAAIQHLGERGCLLIVRPFFPAVLHYNHLAGVAVVRIARSEHVKVRCSSNNSKHIPNAQQAAVGAPEAAAAVAKAFTCSNHTAKVHNLQWSEHAVRKHASMNAMQSQCWTQTLYALRLELDVTYALLCCAIRAGPVIKPEDCTG
jgi:hypothetical protein